MNRLNFNELLSCRVPGNNNDIIISYFYCGEYAHFYNKIYNMSMDVRGIRENILVESYRYD